MDDGELRRRGPRGESEYRVQLPETVSVDSRQLLLALGVLVPTERSEVPTLAEFFPRFLNQFARANRQKPATVQGKDSHFRIHLATLLGSTRLDQVSHEQIQQLKASLGYASAKTVNNVLSTLSKALKVAVEWGVISRMPVQIKQLPRQEPSVKFYEKEEYFRLQLGAQSAGPRQFVVVTLGADCGLRQGEMRGLEWQDVDFERELINIERSLSAGEVVSPKSGKSRVVPLTPDAAGALKRLPRTKSAVLLNDDGERLSMQNARTLLAQAQRAAGLPDAGSTHILRHTYCSHLAMAGVPARAIQELAGHASLRTTERYMHLAPGERGKAIEQLGRYRLQR